MLRSALILVLLSFATPAIANEAAPYSAEANERILRVETNMQQPDLSSSDNQKNLANLLEHLNKLYARADYDFPKSLAQYYQELADRSGIADKRRETRLIATTASRIETLKRDMAIDVAFPGKQYEGVRVAYESMKAAERGIKPSEDSIRARELARNAAAVTAREREQNLLRGGDSHGPMGSGLLVVALPVIAICLVGFLLWPVRMYFQRKKLAADEKRAPYVYIKKHGKHPD